MDLARHKVREEKNNGKSDCQGKKHQSSSKHSEKKEEILESTPDCIWTLQARANTTLQLAGYPLLHFSLFYFYIVSNRGAAQYFLYNLHLESCKEPKIFNSRNCPAAICN